MAKNKPRKVFGRRQSRPLNKTRAQAIETLMPLLGVDTSLLTEDGTLAPSSLFDRPYKSYRLEIGFGNGEHLDALADAHPDTGFIGAEPYINGMAAFLKDRMDKNNENIRVHQGDALELVHSFADQSFERIYILNPDPWPKKRHHKRRIINQDNLYEYARVLKPGGLLYSATDVDDLAGWIVEQCHHHPAFTWIAQQKSDWEKPPVDWPLITRYAEKGIEAGRTQRYFIFKRA